MFNKQVPENRLIATYVPKRGFRAPPTYSYKVDMIFSDDLFVTKRLALPRGNFFYKIGTMLFASQLLDQASQQITLFQSSLYSKYPLFTPAQIFPTVIKDHSYSFIFSAARSILHVSHSNHGLYGNIYTSSLFFDRFTKSLEYVARDRHGKIDFHEVAGLSGIFLANVFDKKFIEQHLEEIALAEEDETKQNILENLPEYRHTVISFNSGGSWHRPQKEGSQENINLFGFSNHTSSRTGGLGVIIGTGNAGKYLNPTAENNSLFVSTNNGRSFKEVKKGSWHFQLLNNGSVLAIARRDQSTTSIEYSLNLGTTWTLLEIFKAPLLIDTLENELSTNLLVISKNNETKEGTIAILDFSQLNLRPCVSSAILADSDFEDYTPTDFKDNKCLSGMSVEYVRKKSEKECALQNDWMGAHFDNTCECTIEDFECDLGYSKNEAENVCVREEGYVEPDHSKHCRDYYYISRGYRRIPGNQCQDNKAYDPIKVSCPMSHEFGFVLGILMLGGLAVLCCIGCLLSNGSMTIEFNEMNGIFADESVGLKRGP